MDKRSLEFLNEPPAAPWAPLLLRLVVGYGSVQHGVAKVTKGPDAFAAILQAIGVPAPHLTAWLTILTELFGGIAVLLGAFISLVSLPLAAVLLVAIFTVHLPYGFSSIKLIAFTPAGARFGPVGYETNLLYLAALACLVMGGSGRFAVDGFRAKRRKEAARKLMPRFEIGHNPFELESDKIGPLIRHHGVRGKSF
jgi:putative oxidoreductase